MTYFLALLAAGILIIGNSLALTINGNGSASHTQYGHGHHHHHYQAQADRSQGRAPDDDSLTLAVLPYTGWNAVPFFLIGLACLGGAAWVYRRFP